MNGNSATKQTAPQNQSLSSFKISPVKVPPGAKQIGNYILGKTIGSGTFGKVHLGLHIPTGQRVAVKIIQRTKLSQKDLQHIYRQVQILRRILHPSLIQLYQIIQTAKSILLITEYMQNGQLFNYIVQRQKLTEEESCQIFHQIMDGLQYMHGIGITHRDIKPQNILIDYNGKVKIIDFGLSNFYQKNQMLRTQCGSPCYAAPQMIKGNDKYDPLKVDIWSVGVVLFSMLAGYLPFCDAEIEKLYNKILSGKFKFPVWVSEEAQNLISSMLTIDPAKRITFQQIFQHPWYKKAQIKKGVGIDPRFDKVPSDHQIIHRINQIGIKAPTLFQDLQKNVKSQLTALYYILVKKLVRDNKIIPSFFGYDNFDQALVKPLLGQKDFFNSTIEQVQTVSPITQDEQFSSPFSNCENPLFLLRAAELVDALQQIMNKALKSQDEKIIELKDKFYKHNLDLSKKRTQLKSTIISQKIKQKSTQVNDQNKQYIKNTFVIKKKKNINDNFQSRLASVDTRVDKIKHIQQRNFKKNSSNITNIPAISSLKKIVGEYKQPLKNQRITPYKKILKIRLIPLNKNIYSLRAIKQSLP